MCGGCRPAALLASSSLLRLIERRRDAQMVGKWHMGEFRRAYTPTFRGYDTFLGCELHTAPPPPPRRVCQSLRCRQPRADRECVRLQIMREAKTTSCTVRPPAYSAPSALAPHACRPARSADRVLRWGQERRLGSICTWTCGRIAASAAATMRGSTSGTTRRTSLATAP